LSRVHNVVPLVVAPRPGCVKELSFMIQRSAFCRRAASFNKPLNRAKTVGFAPASLILTNYFIAR
jgi:hypothetical protein